MKMIFEDGFFHADAHPGNMFIEPEERIALIDFGMVGIVDETVREGLAVLIVGTVSGDADRVVDGLLTLGVTGPHLDRAALRRNLQPKLSVYKGGAGSPGLSPVLQDVMEIIRRHHLVLPGNLSLLVGKGPRSSWTPSSAWARRLGRAAPDLAWLATEAPGAVRRFMGELESGSLKVDHQPRGFEPSLRRLERIGNRLVLGMIVAALIVGLGVSASVYHPATWSSALGTVVTVGFVLAPV